MAGFNLAYGNRDKINKAIEAGTIPPGSLIITDDSSEIFFYDTQGNLKIYEQKSKFHDREECIRWIADHGEECTGQIYSIHNDSTGKCELYLLSGDKSSDLERVALQSDIFTYNAYKWKTDFPDYELEYDDEDRKVDYGEYHNGYDTISFREANTLRIKCKGETLGILMWIENPDDDLDLIINGSAADSYIADIVGFREWYIAPTYMEEDIILRGSNVIAYFSEYHNLRKSMVKPLSDITKNEIFRSDNFPFSRDSEVGTKGFDIIGYDTSKSAYHISYTTESFESLSSCLEKCNRNNIPLRYSISLGTHYDSIGSVISAEKVLDDDDGRTYIELVVDRLIYNYKNIYDYTITDFLTYEDKIGTAEDTPIKGQALGKYSYLASLDPHVGPYDYYDTCTLFFCSHPELGTKKLTRGAISFGSENIVQGEGGLAVGRRNTIIGNRGVAIGQDNEVGYNSFSVGSGNKSASSLFTNIIGRDNKVEENFDNVTLIGQKLKAGNSYQTALGLYNEGRDDTFFEIGVGYQETVDGKIVEHRVNAMEVARDHHNPTTRFKSIESTNADVTNLHVSQATIGDTTNLSSARGKYLSGQRLSAGGYKFKSQGYDKDLLGSKDETKNYTGIYLGGPAGSSPIGDKLPSSPIDTFNASSAYNFGDYITVNIEEINERRVSEGLSEVVSDYFFVIMKLSLSKHKDYINSDPDLSKINIYKILNDGKKDIGTVQLGKFTSFDDIHYVIFPIQNIQGISRQGIYFNNQNIPSIDNKHYELTIHDISIYQAMKVDVPETSKIEFFSSTVDDINLLQDIYLDSISTKESPKYLVSGCYEKSEITSKYEMRTLIAGITTDKDIEDVHIHVYSSEHANLKLKEYTDKKLGDIESALDELHSYAQTIITRGAKS